MVCQYHILDEDIFHKTARLTNPFSKLSIILHIWIENIPANSK